ncbi:serine hydrolase domain-containing protein [Paenarthrobacter sp. NPDC056912]|uniref:serine hydrolase domain-containing protein n=1 Tax=Paenarthrobacter sp. NPDC056912 TaxID=3345965 RepID=UPI00366E28F5
MSHRRIASLLVLMFSGWFLSGCTGGTPVPSPSPAAAAAPTDSLERTIQHFVDDGATSVVVQVRWPAGEWSGSYGVRSLEGAQAARAQDRFSAGSVTKSMVAAEVMKLVDQDLIELDHPVNEFLEAVEPALHPPGPVTVRQLLNHTSGMPDYLGPLHERLSVKEVAGTRLSMREGLHLAANLPWESRNVGYFNYSNSNYLALGLLIEKLRSKPLGDALKSDVFEPLGLDKTSLSEPDRTAGDNLHGYIVDGGRQLDVTQSEGLVGSPAGGVVSTTGDINDFYRALLSGKLLAPASVEEMKKTGLGDYGLGLMRSGDGCSAGYRYGHGGIVYGYLTTSITSNDGGSQVTLAMALPPLPASGNDATAERRVGLYASQMESAAQETLDRLCQ